MAGDSYLMNVDADGVIGPKTVKAVNYAIDKITGPLPYFSKGNMNVTNTRQYAGGLAQTFISYIKQRGGKILAPPASKARGRGSAPIPLGPSTAGPTSTSTGPSSDNKWIWYVVGGVSVLLVLGIVARSVRRSPAAQPAKA